MKLQILKNTFNEFFFEGYDKHFDKYGHDMISNERVNELLAKNNAHAFRLVKVIRKDNRFGSNMIDEVIEIQEKNADYLKGLKVIPK